MSGRGLCPFMLAHSSTAPHQPTSFIAQGQEGLVEPAPTPPNPLLTDARCREMVSNSPTALRVLKAALNADEDGAAGSADLAGSATLLFYQTKEAEEVGGGEGCIAV